MGEGTRCNAHLITKLGIVEMLFLDDQLDFFFVSHVLMGFMWVFSIFYKGKDYFPNTKTFSFLFVIIKFIFLF